MCLLRISSNFLLRTLRRSRQNTRNFQASNRHNFYDYRPLDYEFQSHDYVGLILFCNFLACDFRDFCDFSGTGLKKSAKSNALKKARILTVHGPGRIIHGPGRITQPAGQPGRRAYNRPNMRARGRHAAATAS
jgi:hypothetical protein